jgi:hypothetical protein
MDDMGHWVAAQRFAAAAAPRVASYRLPNPAFRFYAEQHVTFLDGAAESRAFFDAPRSVLLPDAQGSVRRIRRAGCSAADRL